MQSSPSALSLSARRAVLPQMSSVAKFLRVLSYAFWHVSQRHSAMPSCGITSMKRPEQLRFHPRPSAPLRPRGTIPREAAGCPVRYALQSSYITSHSPEEWHICTSQSET